VNFHADKRDIPRRKQLGLGLDVSLREAVQAYLKHRWPAGTAKFADRAYALSPDRAREAVQGRASLTTVERIIKVDGWPALLNIGARMLGQSVDNYIISQRTAHAEHAAHLGEVVFGFAALGSHPAADHPDNAFPLGERRRSFRDRRGQGEV
jgi:hypothetical protein